MRQIAFYGKGGIGKSTTVSNLSAILASSKNKKILQIGCDPKHDSTRNLLSGVKLSPVLDLAKNTGITFSKEDIMKKGFAGIECIESGGPEPGIGCAGRGIILVMDIIKKMGIFENDYDYVFYDVLGDVVCGGFAVPIRQNYASEVYLITSGEFMSLYASNNIAKALKNFGEKGNVRLAGVIGNKRNIKNEDEILKAFAHKLGTEIIKVIPRDNLIQEAEANKQTVVEYDPASNQSKIYLELSDKIENNNNFIIPTPMTDEELEDFYFSNLK